MKYTLVGIEYVGFATWALYSVNQCIWNNSHTAGLIKLGFYIIWNGVKLQR